MGNLISKDIAGKDVHKTINEKGITCDALSSEELQIVYRSVKEVGRLLNPHLFLPPLRKRISSDFKTLHPFPALVALMRPQRMYLKKVGFVILRY